MPPWLTPAKYAARRGCDHRTVERAIVRGDIPTSKSGKVDAGAVDTMWSPKVTRPKQSEIDGPLDVPKRESDRVGVGVGVGVLQEPNEFQRARQHAEILKLRRLERAEQRELGESVSKTEARQVLADFAHTVGDLLDALPSSMTRAIEHGVRCRGCGHAVEARDVLIAMDEHVRVLREHLAKRPFG